MMDQRLVERETELEVLDAALRAAGTGAGALVMIEGAAGVGKSSLLAVARERAAAAGARTLAARGSEIERGVPFGLAGRLLDSAPDGAASSHGAGASHARATTLPASVRALVPAPPGADPGERALALIGGLQDALLAIARAPGSKSRALALCVDDAQWGDDMSLRFLVHLALRLEYTSIALLVAVRSGEQGSPEQPLSELRGAQSARVLRPRALSAAAVAELARASLGNGLRDEYCRACAEATGGNPFYLRELLRTLSAEGDLPAPDEVRAVAPAAVLRAVIVRVGRLGPAAGALARAVAVLGDGALLHDAAELAGLDERGAEDAADALARAGVLAAGEPLCFSHQLVGAALAADMGTFERRREHRRAADLLAARGAPPEQLAPHLLRVAPARDAEVSATLRAAAAAADARGDPATAARMLARALDEPPEEHDRHAILLEIARTEMLAGLPGAEQRLGSALDAIGDPHARARALASMATLAQLSGRHGEAVAHARRGRAELAPGDPLERHLLGLQAGSTLLDPQLGHEPVAELEALRERALSGDLPDDPALLASLAMRLTISDPPELVRSVAERAVAERPLLDDDARGGAIGWLASALTFVDELDFAAGWLDDAIAHAQRRGAVIAESVARMRRAAVALPRGELAAAIAGAQRSLRSWGPGSTWRWSWPLLARAHTLRGELDEAAAAIAQAERASAEFPEQAFLEESRSLLELARGEPEAALATARSAGETVSARYNAVPARINSWRTTAALAAVRLGRREQARELLAPALAELRAIGPARQLGAALVADGLAAGGSDGLALLGEAVDVLRGSPAALVRAQALLELGGALRRARRRRAAREPLYEALELATAFGAQPLAGRARGELNGLGDRPRRPARSGVASLTPAERRVAQLATDGLTTPQIARELVVTGKTVETHLGRIYRKLGVSGRRELPAALGPDR